MPIKKRTIFYVFHRGGNHPPKDPAQPFEIQILDTRGRAKLVGHVGVTENELELGSVVVPAAVLEAARNLPEGESDTVDDSGKSVNPFWWIPKEHLKQPSD